MFLEHLIVNCEVRFFSYSIHLASSTPQFLLREACIAYIICISTYIYILHSALNFFNTKIDFVMLHSSKLLPLYMRVCTKISMVEV